MSECTHMATTLWALPFSSPWPPARGHCRLWPGGGVRGEGPKAWPSQSGKPNAPPPPHLLKGRAQTSWSQLLQSGVCVVSLSLPADATPLACCTELSLLCKAFCGLSATPSCLPGTLGAPHSCYWHPWTPAWSAACVSHSAGLLGAPWSGLQVPEQPVLLPGQAEGPHAQPAQDLVPAPILGPVPEPGTGVNNCSPLWDMLLMAGDDKEHNAQHLCQEHKALMELIEGGHAVWLAIKTVCRCFWDHAASAGGRIRNWMSQRLMEHWSAGITQVN